jgi:hypothetical protein
MTKKVLAIGGLLSSKHALVAMDVFFCTLACYEGSLTGSLG